MNDNPYYYYYSPPPTRSQSESDLTDLLDSNVDILSLFHSPAYSSSSSSSTITETSSPTNSHYDDDSILLQKDESECSINETMGQQQQQQQQQQQDTFLDFITYHPHEENLSTAINKNKSHRVQQIRILGVPNKGAKSRVETQIKLCIQLIGEHEKKDLNWSYIQVNEKMLAKSRLRKNQQQQQQSLLSDGSTIATMISDESKVLQLEAKVICATTNDTIRMCVGCVRREKKRAERSKKDNSKRTEEDDEKEDMEAERDRILLFNCNPLVNFSSGDAILPTRITCYCRHHNEKVGFKICFTMKDYRGMIVASGISPPIMITDDHKSSKKQKDSIIVNQTRSRKRSRAQPLPKNCPISTTTTTISHTLDTPASSRRSSLTKDSNNNHPSSFIGTQSIVTPTNTPSINTAEEPSSFLTSHPESFITSSNYTEFVNPNNLDLLFPNQSNVQKEAINQQQVLFDVFQQQPVKSSIMNYNSSNDTSSFTIPTDATNMNNNSTNTTTEQEEEHETWPFNRRRKISHQQQKESYNNNNSASTSANQPIPNALISSLLMLDNLSTPTPQLERLVPSKGPTYGGIEVTLLGSGFYQGLTCLFGEHAATTTFWNENTLVCVLPPATHTGPVVVSFKEHPLLVLEGQDVVIFTYYDATDQALLELALQVVGLKMTGKLQDAKHVAMHIVQGNDDNHVPQSNHGNKAMELLSQAASSHALDFRQTNKTGQTLLHLAVMAGNQALIQMLLTRYLPQKEEEEEERLQFLNAQDRNKMTALHFACQSKSKEIIHLLLEAGADSQLKSNWGLPSSFADNDILDLLCMKRNMTKTHIKRKSLPRRNSVKSHMMHRFHTLSHSSESSNDDMSRASELPNDNHTRSPPTMESDGLGFAKHKIDRRLYLFWLPVLIVAIGLLFVQMFGQPALMKPLLELLPIRKHNIPLKT